MEYRKNYDYYFEDDACDKIVEYWKDENGCVHIQTRSEIEQYGHPVLCKDCSCLGNYPGCDDGTCMILEIWRQAERKKKPKDL